MIESNNANVPKTCPFKEPGRIFSDFEQQRYAKKISFSEALGGYVVARYDDIVYALDHPETFASKGVTVPDFPEVVKPIFSNRVPPGGTPLGLTRSSAPEQITA